MPGSPKNLTKLWQELKRRKVFKVIAMYAGTAFIILQLVDIIAQPLQWPAWTMTFVIVLLCIGFIIALLISWIYDITPEGIKKTESMEVVKKKKSHAIPVKRRLKASDIIIAAMAVVIVILLYPKIFKRNTLEKLRSSGERIVVAVMPFQNMTNDTIWDVWQDGIQTNLITSLSNNPEELQVRQIESVTNLIQSKRLANNASITPSVASTVSKKLDANVFISGNINKSGSTIRLNAQLVDSKTEDIIKSFQMDGTVDRILPIIDSLSRMIDKFLIITKLGKELAHDFQPIASTNSPEAYRYLIYGDNAFFIKRDYPSATKFYSQAVAIDSNFTVAIIKLSLSFDFQLLYDQAKECLMRAYQTRDQMSMQQRLFVNYAYAWLFETPYEEIKYLKQLLEFDDEMPFVFESLGFSYEKLLQYEKEIPEYEKALRIYKKWDSKPPWVFSYAQLGTAYHKTGQYKKERKLYKKAEHDFPDDPLLIHRQTTLSLTEGDTVAANRYVSSYISLSKERSVSDISILNNLAFAYEEAGIPDKAEEFYRKALSLQPENPIRLNNLAWFLIDKDRNINEGMELIDKALKLSPDEYYMLDTKGWGFYKQGRYEEALELLEKAWNLKPVYDHELFLHLEAAKKAVAGLKNN